MTLTAIDAFSGAGGLSVGLKRAGFKVLAAIETESHACDTYSANHPEVLCINRDIREVAGATLFSEFELPSIDLLAGCPPCQGFTSLTAKYKKGVDQRDELVLEVARLAEETKPRAIMMENVPGLAHKGKRLFKELQKRLCDMGYLLNVKILQTADYGVPQFRKRLVLLAGLGFSIPMPQPTHAASQMDGLRRWKTVRDAIGGMPSPMKLSEAKAHDNRNMSNWHVVRNMTERNMARLNSLKAGEIRSSIPENLKPRCHRDGYPGYSNVYGRMQWDRPSPTITGGCTTLSKGRFGHPDQPRTISVREAALLQSFPIDYKLTTPYMEHVCNMIGNALPCDFAEVISRQSANMLLKTDNSL